MLLLILVFRLFFNFLLLVFSRAHWHCHWLFSRRKEKLKHKKCSGWEKKGERWVHLLSGVFGQIPGRRSGSWAALLWTVCGASRERLWRRRLQTRRRKTFSSPCGGMRRGFGVLGGADLERGKRAAPRYRVKADSRGVVWSSGTGPGKWSRRRPSPASSRPRTETGEENDETALYWCVWIVLNAHEIV